MKTVHDLTAASIRLSAAMREVSRSFRAVVASDGVQLVRDLKVLCQPHSAAESALICESTKALMSSIEMLHSGPYADVVKAVAALQVDFFEYLVSHEPIPEAAKSALAAQVAQLRRSLD
jgi:hypothetical protein